MALIDLDLLNEAIEKIEKSPRNEINVSDIFEYLSKKEEFSKCLKKKSEYWIVDCKIDIVEECQKKYILNPRLYFACIIFLQDVNLHFENLELFFYKIKFCGLTHIVGNTLKNTKAKLQLSFGENLKSNKKFIVINCEIEKIFFLPNLKMQIPLEFFNCFFKDAYELVSTKSLKSLVFSGCTFSEYFSLERATIDKEVYFYKNNFLERVYFNQAIFSDNVLFYENTFEKNVSFYGATLLGLPLVISNVFKNNFNILGLKGKIEYKEIKNEIQKTKNVMSSSFTAIDLISTEISARDGFRFLKNILIKEGNLLNASDFYKAELYSKEIELDSKPQKSWQDRIDLFQLWFYRNTSEHHTDLLKIIAWVIIAIGSFGFLFFLLKCFQDVSIISQLNPYSIALSFAGAISLWISWSIGYIHRLSLFAGIGLIFTLWIACYKPILIFGAINLIDKTPRSGFENFLLVLYTIVMILLLFSLQKTARKNSIIPS